VNKAIYTLSNVTLVEGSSLGAIWEGKWEGIRKELTGKSTDHMEFMCSWTLWQPVISSHCHNVDSIINQEFMNLHFHTCLAYHHCLMTRNPTGSKVVQLRVDSDLEFWKLEGNLAKGLVLWIHYLPSWIFSFITIVTRWRIRKWMYISFCELV